jgi:hypothetical protein
MSNLSIPAGKASEGYMGGSKWEGGNAHLNLSAREIAARTRAYVKALGQAGEVDADIKVSVTSERFAGGSAVNVVFSSTAASGPYDDGPLWDANPEYDPTNPYDPRYPQRTLRPSVKALAAKVETFGRSFIEYDVNSMVDYFQQSVYFSLYAGGPDHKGGGTCI